ncbi:uncharacterized protein N7483_005849 [Penicillium malachiteum]|uniref:uncharacterized protein n=1 Tax=Penicillium malachiteum TaxID=1324776 RepID=UPI002549B743|nr:uncharacterized protein N7483_005849 [Penicillium malachiteum]KAJ5731341.1 hypothetical protein N7483_005849 [Penicillium malachiteum]
MASQTKSSLLLLPPPQSFSFSGVKEAFETSVSDVLVKLSKTVENSNQIATLYIALAVPNLLSLPNKPRANTFAPLQHYLSSIYTLIGAVGTARDIDLDSPGGIDTRVIFIDHLSSNTSTISPGSKLDASNDLHIGPILKLHSLATSGRQWNHVFYLNNQIGRELADSFVTSLPSPSKDHTASIMQKISCSGDWQVPASVLVPEDQPSLKPHYSVAVGGTFDHLHIGHKLLLTATALALEPLDPTNQDQARILTVGVTGDALLVNKKFAEYLESWEERFQSTASFLAGIMDFSPQSHGSLGLPKIERSRTSDDKGQVVAMYLQPNLIYKFVEFFDICGPTLTDEDISALVVSKETSAGGAMVNEERAKKGWARLTIFEVDVLQSGEATAVTGANPFEGKISSTDIRRRRMNRAKV